MKKKTTLGALCKALKTHDHYLLSCHVAPEGDAIGSLLALDSLLRRLGKKTTVVCEDPVPERLSLLSSKRWRLRHEVKFHPSAYRALVMTDCPSLERIGTVRELLTPETVIFNIDHHVSNGFFGHYNYVCPEAAATGEVVMDIFRWFKMPLTKEDATKLYAALSTDTGSFKYGNTTVESHRLAAELIAAGINLEKINEELYSTYSLNKINLYSRLLARVKTTAQGRIAWVVMRREDLSHSGACYEDTEGFIDFLRYLKEVCVAFFLYEMPKNSKVKVSFRSKGSYDVNQIATCFGGGGHKKAAACTLSTSLEEAEKMVVERITKECRFT